MKGGVRGGSDQVEVPMETDHPVLSFSHPIDFTFSSCSRGP